MGNVPWLDDVDMHCSRTPIPSCPEKLACDVILSNLYKWIALTAARFRHWRRSSSPTSWSDMRRESMVAFTLTSSSCMAVCSRRISIFNLWISSCACWILKCFTVASRWVGLVQSKVRTSERDWCKRSNSPRKLYSTISFHVSCGRGGTRAAAWVLYRLSALRIASEHRCKALPICWRSL